jgi:polyisoprenoid-binding protein YceI
MTLGGAGGIGASGLGLAGETPTLRAAFVAPRDQEDAMSQTWKLDPTHTAVEFAVKHMMFTTVRGRFKGVSGTIAIDERDPAKSRVDVDIDAASIDTAVADRDTHLRSADFLDVENHPKLSFRSRRVEGAHARQGDRFRVVGDLEIRGKAIEVTLDCTFEGVGKDPWGGDRAGFAATTRIDRRDWGLMWNQALETGGILVANEVKIEIEAQTVLEGAAEPAHAEA